MKLNGFIVFGIVAVFGGWMWLFAGSSVEAGLYGLERVYNVQLGTMAQQLIGFGYTMLIVGTLVSGFEWLKPRVAIADADSTSGQSPYTRGAASINAKVAPNNLKNLFSNEKE